MSTKTGTAPIITTVLAEATKENADVITSSPGPTPTAFRARSSASVPELRPMPWRAPPREASSDSSAPTSGPRMKRLPARTRAVAASSSSAQRRVLAHEVDLGNHWPNPAPTLVPN